MPNSVITTPVNPNKNLYNGGSEWQNDFSDMPDFYQTYYRNYDPNLGRFLGVDPMAEATDYLTVYNYSGNNPVMFNDPMGDLQMTANPYRKRPPVIPGTLEYDLYYGWTDAQLEDYRIRTGSSRYLIPMTGGEIASMFNGNETQSGNGVNGGGSGEGGGRNIIISPEGKILSISKPDPLQKGDTFALSTDWDAKGGVAGTGTGTTKPIDASEALDLINKWLGYANNFTELGSLALGKGFDAFYESRSLTTQIATFGRYTKTSELLKSLGKIGGGIGYAGALVSVYSDYKAMEKGQISLERFEYRLGGTATATIVGIKINPVAGAIVAGSFWAGEKSYDAFNLWLYSTSKYIADFNRGLSNGWYPGKQ